MKRLINSNSLIIAVLSVLLFACEEETVAPPNTDNGSGTLTKNIKVNGTLHAFAQLNAYNNPIYEGSDWLQFSANGQMDALDLTQVDISHTYKANMDEDGFIEFEDGEFVIYGLEGNALYGSMSGTGYLKHGNFSAEWFLTIEGGEGRYEGARGYLREVIYPENESLVDLVYKVEITGSIQLVEEI
jgi:hypothetical protein